MPMEAIELVIGHRIELLFEHIDGEEVARTVDHDAAIGIFWIVGDVHMGQSSVLFELLKRLQTIEKAHGCGGFDEHSAARNGELIALKAHTVGRHTCLFGRAGAK